MSETQLLTIKISDIHIGERFRKTFDDSDIQNLAASIVAQGLLQPVRVFEMPDTVPQQYELIAGERRVRAHLLLGRDTIEALTDDGSNIDDPKMAEISENNDRKQFTVIERLRIADHIRSKIPERRGKKGKSVDFQSDAKTRKSVELPREGEETIDFLARKSGFGSGDVLIRARKVAEDAIPEVVDAMDKEVISINRAHVIAQSPKKNQLTKLNEAITDPDTLSAKLTASENARRTLKRKAKNGIPLARIRRPEHRIIRIAPNWRDEVLADIYNLPIDDFAAPDLAVVALECESEFLPCAFDCLDRWGFDFADIVTVWNPAAEFDINLYTKHRSYHIVIGQRINNPDPTTVLRLLSVIKAASVLSRHTTPLTDSLIHIIEDIFPDAKADKRIDMTSTNPRKGWIIWKNTYGDPAAASDVRAGSKPAPSDPDPDPASPAPQFAAPVDTTDVQTHGRASLPTADTDDTTADIDAIDFETEHFHADPIPDDEEPVDMDPPKREIKIF